MTESIRRTPVGRDNPKWSNAGISVWRKHTAQLTKSTRRSKLRFCIMFVWRTFIPCGELTTYAGISVHAVGRGRLGSPAVNVSEIS